MQQLNDLTGKVALISGAARGIGARTAEVFAAQGAAVCLTDIADADGKALTDKISATGAKATYIHHDVTSEAEWDKAVEHTLKTLGGLDILINNAGIEKIIPVADTSLDDFREIMAINVDGVFLGTRAAFRVMRPGGAAGKGGSIVNLSSVAGMIGFVGLSAYGATKGAVRLFSRHAAVEAGRLGYNIRVNSIHPAVVSTRMGENLIHKAVDIGMAPDVETSRAAILSMIPSGTYGTVDDIAALITFLSSDASRWITGAEIAIDGGFTAA